MIKAIRLLSVVLVAGAVLSLSGCAMDRESKRKSQMDDLQKQFSWWPTDAKPAPVKDAQAGGYWWWPQQPGEMRPWGNRGYVYVYKIIFDYKSEEIPPEQKMRPSLLIKKILKNVKVYFDYNKSLIRGDAKKILLSAVTTLRHNPETDILITGNCDARGSEEYNQKLGQKRGAAVKRFMIENGIPEERIRIVSRGKLNAVAHVSDLVGMQKDRNAQFMIAEVEEVNIPSEGIPPSDATKVEEGKYISNETEEVASAVKVSTKEYVIQKNDSLWKIAEKELGNGSRWKNIYELNKEKIKNPNKLKSGTTIEIPVE